MEQAIKQQKGLGFMGVIFVIVVFSALVLVGIKTAPAVIEYFTILRNIKAIAVDAAAHTATNGSINSLSPAEIRKAYDMRASIDNIPSITGRDLEISKQDDETQISFTYSKKIPLVKNVSLWIDFSGNSAPKR